MAASDYRSPLQSSHGGQVDFFFTAAELGVPATYSDLPRIAPQAFEVVEVVKRVSRWFTATTISNGNKRYHQNTLWSRQNAQVNRFFTASNIQDENGPNT